MEPQENRKINLQKAVSTAEQAEAALVDVLSQDPDPKYEQMLADVRRILNDLRADAATTPPDAT